MTIHGFLSEMFVSCFSGQRSKFLCAHKAKESIINIMFRFACNNNNNNNNNNNKKRSKNNMSPHFVWGT